MTLCCYDLLAEVPAERLHFVAESSFHSARRGGYNPLDLS
jgi:hypothetical protein